MYLFVILLVEKLLTADSEKLICNLNDLYGLKNGFNIKEISQR
jgi:hypothetical protein